MNNLVIYCDQYDFSPLARAFAGEFECDGVCAAEIIITDEGEIQRLNAQFRQIDRPTDVLSFPALNLQYGKSFSSGDFPFDKDENGNLFLGSIAICEQVARRQAEEYGHSFERELCYLAAHGVCHLLGYDHMTEEDKPAMRAKEEKVLKKLGLERTE